MPLCVFVACEDNSDDDKPNCENSSEKATIAVESFEAKMEGDFSVILKADCVAVIEAMQAFADCLPDGQEKSDALVSLTGLRVFCAFIN